MHFLGKFPLQSISRDRFSYRFSARILRTVFFYSYVMLKGDRMRFLIQIVGYVVLLVGSVTFGFLGQPAEMGLAIVAGAITLAFSDIEKFSKIKGAGFEAEIRERIEKIDAVIEKETEPNVSGEERKSVPDISQVDVATRKVVSALQHPEYTWRYFNGIRKDTGLSDSEVRRCLSWLAERSYARKSLGSHGAVWNLTEEGRYLSAVVDFS